MGALEGDDRRTTSVSWPAFAGSARRAPRRRSRARLVRRLLLLADIVGLIAAFAVTEAVRPSPGGSFGSEVTRLFLFFVISLPAWVLAASLYGLYDRDEERTDHSTTDDVVGVFHLVTVGVWILLAGAWLTGWTTPQLRNTTFFWLLAIAFITTARAAARVIARRSSSYLQTAVIVGGGDVAQLIGRKYLLHAEYGIQLLGLVDDDPRPLRDELAGVEVWPSSELVAVVRDRHVDRVLVAFSGAPDARTLGLVHELRKLDVQVDIVPRLFEVMPPNVEVHSVEGIALLGLRPVRIGGTARAAKRLLDVIGSFILLILTAPLFALAAWQIKRGSPGPVLFRQIRLGQDMREFTALKFRTMTDERHDEEHREYLETIMTSTAKVGENGLYKLERPGSVTKAGRWLRRTSLDELPQLINVLRGDMSLVGPRPCIPYETSLFETHHFDRFAVPAGITGLWQVTARSRATFAEALDLDVAYARGWSLALDLKILARTPTQVFRGQGAR
jgi:exopolysaccharide biosynthesis polyprenyl glycosylphosphotransferase